MAQVEYYGIAIESDEHDSSCLYSLIASHLENLDYELEEAAYEAASRDGSLWITLEERVREALASGFFVCNCN